MSDVVAAVDVGGTRTKAALVDIEGRERVGTTVPTPSGLGRPGALVEHVAAVVDSLTARTDADDLSVTRAAVVVPGIVDERRGSAVFSANLGWRDLPVREPLAERLGLPVLLGHDVRAGLRAEAQWGAGRGARHALFLPLGTGIAGALMVDGHILAADGWSGELGHVVVEPDGERCGCGGRGHLETIASAAAVETAYARRSGRPASGAEIAALVAAGDPDAAAVWDRAVGALADAIVAAVTMTGVDLVIVGGGLSRSGDTLLQPLRQAVSRRVTFQRPPAVVPATLGDRAGCLGAAALAWSAS